MIGASILCLRHPQTCLVFCIFKYVLFPATCLGRGDQKCNAPQLSKSFGPFDFGFFRSTAVRVCTTFRRLRCTTSMTGRSNASIGRWDLGCHVSSRRRHCLEADPLFVGETTRLSKHQRIPSLSPRCTHQRPVIG